MKEFNSFFVIAVAIMSLFFTACGGEDSPDPVDNDPTDNVEPKDNELPDDVQTDDIQTDEEPDEDTAPVPSCTEDELCREKCEPVLNRAGNWKAVEPTGISGTITITLSYDGSDCDIAVSGMWNFSWKLQQLFCLEVEAYASFFSLLEMEGEKLVINQIATKEGCEAGELTPVKFERIQ